ncbi:MAG: hypothetical protein IH885_08810 [Myxococcales bacterium]|nr:hypothetical protein [Myxococcales bacterium]
MNEPEHYVDHQMERTTCGGLLDGDSAALDESKGLCRSDFADPGRGEIVEAIRLHAKNGWPIDPATVNQTLIDHGWAHLAYEIAECGDAFLAPVDSAKMAFYARRLRVLAKFRALQCALGSGWAAIGDTSLDIDERLRLVEQVLLAIAAAKEALRVARKPLK